MKKFLSVILCLTISLASYAKSEIRYMDDLVKELVAHETDLAKVLQQFKSESGPKDPKTGIALQKILWVEKGSAWEKVGAKAGDFLANGTAPEPK